MSSRSRCHLESASNRPGISLESSSGGADAEVEVGVVELAEAEAVETAEIEDVEEAEVEEEEEAAVGEEVLAEEEVQRSRRMRRSSSGRRRRSRRLPARTRPANSFARPFVRSQPCHPRALPRPPREHASLRGATTTNCPLLHLFSPLLAGRRGVRPRGCASWTPSPGPSRDRSRFLCARAPSAAPRTRRSSKRPRSAPRPDVATDEPAAAGAGTTDPRAGDAVEEPTGGAEDSGATAGDDAGAADVGARVRVDGPSGAAASSGPSGPRGSGGSGSKEAMIGLAPKSAFLRWLRSPAQGKGAVAASVATKALQSRRRSAYWHFRETRSSSQKRSADDALDDAPVRVTRSAAPEFDDWTVEGVRADPPRGRAGARRRPRRRPR